MNCANNKCMKHISTLFPCNQCSESFCKKDCLIEHLNHSHTKSIPSSANHHHLNTIINHQGKLLKERIEDPLYNFKNFQFCKTQLNTIQTIGSGAFGEVYLAKNIKDDKLYAIKHVRKSKVKLAGQSLDIIYREISLQRMFLHENIIKLYGHSEDADSFFMILEYANKGTLFSLIRRNDGFDEKGAFHYFIQCVCAVNFLHQNGYVHRDLKPENLLLTNEDKLKLCDFGWCVDASSGARATFCGTYEYMAPEILQEIPYDESIDAWSLGVLLYELLHGYSPFRAESNKGNGFQEIFKNIIKHKYTIEKKISKKCTDLIAKLLTPDNNQRLQVKDIFDHPWVMQYIPKEDMKRITKENNNNKVPNLIKKKFTMEKTKQSNDIKKLFEEQYNSVDNKNDLQKKITMKTNKTNIKDLNDINISEAKYSMFEDNVFEDTLKMIDTKVRRKIKNDMEYDDIRVGQTNKVSKYSSQPNSNDKYDEYNSNIVKANNDFHQSDSIETNFTSNGKLRSKSPAIKRTRQALIYKKTSAKDVLQLSNTIKQVIIDQTETPKNDSISNQIKPIEEEKGDKLTSVINILENAQTLHNSASTTNRIIIRPVESFWDRFFAPFKCGTGNE